MGPLIYARASRETCMIRLDGRPRIASELAVIEALLEGNRPFQKDCKEGSGSSYSEHTGKINILRR